MQQAVRSQKLSAAFFIGHHEIWPFGRPRVSNELFEVERKERKVPTLFNERRILTLEFVGNLGFPTRIFLDHFAKHHWIPLTGILSRTSATFNAKPLKKLVSEALKAQRAGFSVMTWWEKAMGGDENWLVVLLNEHKLYNITLNSNPFWYIYIFKIWLSDFPNDLKPPSRQQVDTFSWLWHDMISWNQNRRWLRRTRQEVGRSTGNGKVLPSWSRGKPKSWRMHC